MIPTTDEMDHITPDERHALVGMCELCGEWTKFDDRYEVNRCKDSGLLMVQTIRTQRTFDVEKAKKETAKYKAKIGAK